jgi:hypothetical protein
MKKVFVAGIAGGFLLLLPSFVFADADVGGASILSPSPSATPTQAVVGAPQPNGGAVVGAQQPAAQNGNVGLYNPLGANSTLPALLSAILALVVRIGTFVVIFMLVYVGYLFVIARGAPGEITKAKQALLWTVVGALILLGAQALAVGIQATVQSIGNGAASPGAGLAPQPTGAAGSINIY